MSDLGGQVPSTVMGLVEKIWPVAGEVMMAGLSGRGPGTTALTSYWPPPEVADLADQVKLASSTPTASTKKVNKAYDVSR